MVTLSRAYSIGVLHCSSFSNRLYFFNTPNQQDPSMESKLAMTFKTKCPRPFTTGSNSTMALDALTPNRIDNRYYVNLKNQRGLLTSDQTPVTSPLTAGMVRDNANAATSEEDNGVKEKKSEETKQPQTFGLIPGLGGGGLIPGIGGGGLPPFRRVGPGRGFNPVGGGTYGNYPGYGPGYGRGGSDFGPGYGGPGNGFNGGFDPGQDGGGFGGPGNGIVNFFPGRGNGGGVVPP
ncbi:hem peroxidase [Dillenia turbinata]|uniref:peroxidase n=1 Tax=Dillenia turbinata TaxID=194707 RepID=A0AAN8UPT5_9MAGN